MLLFQIIPDHTIHRLGYYDMYHRCRIHCTGPGSWSRCSHDTVRSELSSPCTDHRGTKRGKRSCPHTSACCGTTCRGRWCSWCRSLSESTTLDTCSCSPSSLLCPETRSPQQSDPASLCTASPGSTRTCPWSRSCRRCAGWSRPPWPRNPDTGITKISNNCVNQSGTRMINQSEESKYLPD